MDTLEMMQEKAEKEKKAFRVYVKAAVIVLLVLLLFIPTSMINSLIEERDRTAEHAEEDVFMQWGGKQQIVPPYIELKSDSLASITILPNAVSIAGDVETKELKRGIYEIVTMSSSLSIKGDFSFAENDWVSFTNHNKSQAEVSFSVSDLKGITKEIFLNLNGKIYPLMPNGRGASGSPQLTAVVDLSEYVPGEKLEFEIDFVLKGSKSLTFVPVGKTTTVSLTSNCQTPSFSGAFLPEHRDVNKDGFKSEWSVSYLNRSYPQMLNSDYTYCSEMNSSAFGVDLLIPVLHYQKTLRCVKYEALFVILTFALFFFIEVIQKKHLHPVHYTLVGLALVLFYALLLSFSEHIGFSVAYLVAALMMIVMLTLYTIGVLRIRKTAFYVGGALSLLYLYIFVLVQMETFALLAGSLGLFAILAVMMYFSQRINWDE